MDITVPQVLKQLGQAATKTSANRHLLKLIEESIGISHQLIKEKKIIRGELITVNTGSTVKLADGYEFHSTHIARLLNGCHTAYGFAVTIGKAVEEKRDLCVQEKDATGGLIFDAIGSVAVEMLAGSVHAEIEREVDRTDSRATRRFSPGYGNWTIDNQKSFLPWLEAEKINIRLIGNCLMYPEKSISAVLGAFKQ
ncbi:MAG: hypothetical protein GF384_05015 [Elusimicrobia bacterium]|nr:hypothetical protein [Elusimicrobiota bacterium]MBD3412152.1 hypothetical protein [Elusimicrobiota bacterium]